MKKIILFSAMLFGIFGYAGAQSVIVSAQAFSTTIIGGMPRKGNDGRVINPVPQVNRFIYIETNGKARPELETILYDNIAYKAFAVDSSRTLVIAGTTAKGKQVVLETANKNNYIWRINVAPVDVNKSLTGTAGTITLKGKAGGIEFTSKLKKETTLVSPALP